MQSGDTVRIAGFNVPGRIVAVEQGPDGSRPRYRVEHISYQRTVETVFDSGNLTAYRTMSDAARETEIRSGLQTALALAKEALAVLLPKETVAVSERGDGLVGCEGLVEIVPKTYDNFGSGEVIQKLGWSVRRRVHRVGNKGESYPPLVALQGGAFPTVATAVTQFIKAIFDTRANTYWREKDETSRSES